MQLSELSSCNSILDTQLMELESANSMQATEPHKNAAMHRQQQYPKRVECTCKSATSKYGMHLQKCNRNIANLQLTPRGRNQLRKNADHSRKGPVRSLRKALVEGECEIWGSLCPGFAPNPFLCFFCFGVSFWSLVGLVVLRLRGARSVLLLAASTCNAVRNKRRGRGRDSHPPI